MKYLRNLYEWVLHWAETPYALPALFILAFTESSFFPIPPDALLLALALGKPSKSFFFATICLVGSVLGGMFGYVLGYQFWNWVGEFFLNHIFSEALFFKVQTLYQNNAFVSIFVSGFTPIPYKVFTVSAGVFHLDFFTFTMASILGRGLRFYLVGTTIFAFGPPIKKLIDRYFEAFTLVFTLLLIGGFVMVKWIVH